MGLSDISKEIIDREYDFDPETETIFPRSSSLENGMIVLLRERTDEVTAGWDKSHEVFIEAVIDRWCRVEKLKIFEDGVNFEGLYRDGMRAHREHLEKVEWIVKKTSLPGGSPVSYAYAKYQGSQT